MASLAYKSGIARVQFRHNRKRYTVYLGKMSREDANAFRAAIGGIVASRKFDTPLSPRKLRWLADLPAFVHEKIARTGLVESRDQSSTKIESVINQYIALRTDLKPGTLITFTRFRISAVEFFGADRDIRTINRGLAGDYRRWLAGKYAQATVAMHIKKARQIFKDAIDREIITANPFSGVKAGSQKNSDRQRYISAADIRTVIDSCPDVEWKLIFALARFGGLRCPSEILSLRWQDILWDTGRIVVRSSKTEHFEGRGSRIIPLFPELVETLQAAFAQAADGADFVIAKHRRITNLGTRARKIITRAGLVVWERLFNNLRSSCETDLAAKYPIHVACHWIGNSQAVALAHYLQVTDADYEDAAKSAANHDVNMGANTGDGGSDSHKKPHLPALKLSRQDGNPVRILRKKLVGLEKALHSATQHAIEQLKAYDRKSIPALSAAIAEARGRK